MITLSIHFDQSTGAINVEGPSGDRILCFGMLELAKVNDVVNKAASSVLQPQASVQRVLSKPAVDWTGDEVLHVTIVLGNEGVDGITGDMALDTLVGIERALQAAGEERFPVIDYETEEELALGDDPES